MKKSTRNEFNDDIEDDIWENGRFNVYDCSSGEIEYHERRGKIYWAYAEETPDSSLSFYGQIPESVQTRGSSAIRKYTEKKLAQEKAEQDVKTAILTRFCETPYAIETSHEGIKLKGCIVYTDGSELRVKLESPMVGSESVYFSTAAHRGGLHILDGEADSPMFTADAIQSAKDLLIAIFKKQKHLLKNKKVISVVNALSKGKAKQR